MGWCVVIFLLYLPFMLCWACCYQHVIYERHFCATQDNAIKKKVGQDSLPHELFQKNYGWNISPWNEYYFCFFTVNFR
jgi:hypothetical protein